MAVMPSPRLSVVIPAYNAGTFLLPAALSAVEAAGADAEVIVVDDGSTDQSLATLAGLPIRVLRQANAGEAAARNAGVRAAAGRFVTFLDGDDLLVAGGLEPRLELLEREPAVLAAGGLPSNLIDARDAVLSRVFDRMAARLSFPFELTLERYRRGEFFPVSASLYVYRREAFTVAGLYDETLAAAPDADFHFRLLALAPIPVLPVATFDRRLHRANLSMPDAARGAPEFRPEVLGAIQAVNRRHGLSESDITPWEADYL